MQSGAQGIQTRFVDSVAKDASAHEVAEAAVLIWRNIDAALGPIIGQQGVAALLRRSEYLLRETYPWLAACPPDAPGAPAFDALKSALCAQAAVDSAQANGALLQIFDDLLSSLIGASLSERLLRSAWTPTSAQDAPQ